MQKRFLEVRLHQFENKEYKSKIKSIYKVDLYTLAIGPVHHSIELCDDVSILDIFQLKLIPINCCGNTYQFYRERNTLESYHVT